MRFSDIAQRVGGMGDGAWEVHTRAVDRMDRGEDIILLSIGEERGATTPPEIVNAAQTALANGRHHYAPIIGSTELREAIANRHLALTGQAVGPENIAVMAGAQNALFSVMLCLAGAGDEILCPEPFYATYPGVCRAGGATLVNIACDPDDGFVPRPERIEAAITGKSKVLLINSPNNPTGAVYSKETIEAIADICKRHDLWLVSDEVYVDFIYEGRHIAPAALPDMADRTVTLGSLSKSHRMSGWRVGWAVAPTPLIDLLTDLLCCTLYGIPPFTQDAALRALQPSNALDADRTEMVDAYKGRRDLVCEMLSGTPGLVVRKPAAGMFAMVDVRATGLSDIDFASRLLEEEDVAVMTGTAFGTSAEGHLRLGLVAEESILKIACERIDRFSRRLAG